MSSDIQTASPMAAAPPPLLLPKRLAAFLHANLGSAVTTALLLTPSGKLLAHASPLPASVLRTQCTVAASLWAIQSASATSASVTGALPPQPEQQQQQQPNAQSQLPRPRKPARPQRQRPSAVTVQLSSGAAVVVRRLRCGLLFLAIGPATARGEQGLAQTIPQSALTGSSAAAAATAGGISSSSAASSYVGQGAGANTSAGSTLHPILAAGGHRSAPVTPQVGSPSERASMLSAAAAVGESVPSAGGFNGGGAVGGGAGSNPNVTGGGSGSGNARASGGVAQGSGGGPSSRTASMATRRHAEELARWLDEKLEGLSVPEEGIGVEEVSLDGAQGPEEGEDDDMEE